jgi:hypothetical protein
MESNSVENDGRLYCTICMWESTDFQPEYRAKSPTGTWHLLCTWHMILYAEKYKNPITLTDKVRARLLAGENPFSSRKTRQEGTLDAKEHQGSERSSRSTGPTTR